MFTSLMFTRSGNLHESLLEVERTELEESVKAFAVALILGGRPEEALKVLSDYFKVETPRIEVGMPKRHTGSAGCYIASKATIYVAGRERLFDPRIILHEFYHHLRTRGGRHRGTEKHADKFVREFIAAYGGRVGTSCTCGSSSIEANRS